MLGKGRHLLAELRARYPSHRQYDSNQIRSSRHASSVNVNISRFFSKIQTVLCKARTTKTCK